MIGRTPTIPRLLMWWERAFWVIPLGGVVAGQVLNEVALVLDEAAFEATADGWVPFISASAATTTLAAIGGGMVTFTGFVFSFVVLILQFGSSQYSPRTVSYFLRARSTQVILAIFLMTITFSFLALLEVGSANRADFAPQFSVPIAFVLLFASMTAFVALLGSVGGRVRVDAVVADLGRTARRQLLRRFRTTKAWSSDEPGQGAILAEELPSPIGYVGRVGQLVAVDEGRLVRLARRRGCSIALTVRVGDSVSPHVDVAQVAQGSSSPALARAISGCLVVDVERSLRYDALYSLRLIVDIALRALSPAINDPTTAVRCIDEIEVVLRTAATVRLGDRHREVSAGVSVFVCPATWADVVALALTEIIEAGYGQPQVTRRLAALFADVPADIAAPLRPVLARHAEHLAALVEHSRPGAQVAAVLAPDRQGLGGTR